MRLAGLTPGSAFMHHMYPVDEQTGKRARRAQVDESNVDAYLLRVLGGAA